ncbi:MAG: efflux RND transporter periplasmic adaptor subunit [Sphingomonadaceae bacterium]
MTSGRIIALVAIVLALAAGGWWAFGRSSADRDRYVTAEAFRGPLSETITANGTINPVTVVNVGVQVSGTVERLYADFNDRVREGQLLLELDPRLFRARLAQSEANLANQRAQAALAEANRRRAEQLLKSEFISQQDYDQAVASAQSTRAQVEAAAASVAQDRANLEFSVVRSPVSGVVISRDVDIGQTVASTFQTPTLFKIAADLTKMQIEAAVAESDIGRVREGQDVVFTVDAYGNRRFRGKVSQIRLDPQVQQNVVTFTVVITVDNPDGALLPGMTATATFQVADYADALLVPNAALSFRPADFNPRAMREAGARGEAGRAGSGRAGRGGGGGRSGPPGAGEEPGFPVTLFVLNDRGEPEPRRVRIGATDNDNAMVLSGDLRAGERVIVSDRQGARGGPSAGGQRRGGPPGGGGRGGGGDGG